MVYGGCYLCWYKCTHSFTKLANDMLMQSDIMSVFIYVDAAVGMHAYILYTLIALLWNSGCVEYLCESEWLVAFGKWCKAIIILKCTAKIYEIGSYPSLTSISRIYWDWLIGNWISRNINKRGKKFTFRNRSDSLIWKSFTCKVLTLYSWNCGTLCHTYVCTYLYVCYCWEQK